MRLINLLELIIPFVLIGNNSMPLVAGSFFIISQSKLQVSIGTTPSTGGTGTRLYTLKRGTLINALNTIISNNQTALTFGDPTVVTGTTYFYQINYTTSDGDSIDGSIFQITIESDITYTFPRIASATPWRKSPNQKGWI